MDILNVSKVRICFVRVLCVRCVAECSDLNILALVVIHLRAPSGGGRSKVALLQMLASSSCECLTPDARRRILTSRCSGSLRDINGKIMPSLVIGWFRRYSLGGGCRASLARIIALERRDCVELESWRWLASCNSSGKHTKHLACTISPQRGLSGSQTER